MFTGIIRHLAKIRNIELESRNKVFTFACVFPSDSQIQIDQSIAHNGVCLTVSRILSREGDCTVYQAVAIEETLAKTTLDRWQVGEEVNIELCLRIGDRLDGHFVQGHVDTEGEVCMVKEVGGSWEVGVRFPSIFAAYVVEKGSITVNGVSLTLVNVGEDSFQVAIIPYTYHHTQFQFLRMGDYVNIEFDIYGKYIIRGKMLGR